MNLGIDQKVALITGSSKGIGLGIAKVFLGQNSFVILNGRNEDLLEKAANELNSPNVGIVAGDVTKPDQCTHIVNKIVKNYGRIDCLVCNVGSGTSVPPGEETYDEWHKCLHINLLSTTNIIEAAKQELEKTKGTIVCISSICGVNVLGAPVTYSAAKAALNSYIKGVSRPLAKKGIRINGVAPGNILFPGSVWDRKLKENENAVTEMLRREVSLERLGTPEEIGNWVAFLSSQHSSFSTGQVYIVDGGQVR